MCYRRYKMYQIQVDENDVGISVIKFLKESYDEYERQKKKL